MNFYKVGALQLPIAIPSDQLKSCSDPNCIYCIRCTCTHRADEHIAGDGNCFICECSEFNKAKENV